MWRFLYSGFSGFRFCPERLRPGGRLVINAIRKEGGDREVMAGLSYDRHLWMEKELKSVANVTRADIAGSQ